MDLVPLKVKIGLGERGRAKYPDFNSIDHEVRNNLDWSEYIDAYGTGWLYDDCGHGEEEVRGNKWDSPVGQQWGVILVPKVFADAAVAAFPDDVEKINETETESFYDNYHARNIPENLVNEIALKEFEVRESTGATLSAADRSRRDKALDPNDPAPGINKNPRKKWTDYKALKAIKVVQ